MSPAGGPFTAGSALPASRPGAERGGGVPGRFGPVPAFGLDRRGCDGVRDDRSRAPVRACAARGGATLGGLECCGPELSGSGTGSAVSAGRTLQIYVPGNHKREVETWIGNFRRARQTLEALSTLNRGRLRQGRLFDSDSQ